MIDLQESFGIKVTMDEQSGKLYFPENTLCENSSSKMLSQVTSLLYDSQIKKDEVSYRFYMNIMKMEDRELFREYKVNNGITIIMPGTVNGECRKNSGHFHKPCNGQILPYPEVYEILHGEAMFLLQKATKFDINEDFELEDVRIVVLKKGEKLIVPPFYAHCAVNIGDGLMAFGNLAIPCPLNYEAIQKKRGFFAYIMKKKGKIIVLPNTTYKKIPDIKIVEAKEDLELGINFHSSLYETFVQNPQQFAYLDHPEVFEQRICELIQAKKEEI